MFVNVCSPRALVVASLAIMNVNAAHSFGVAGHSAASAVAESRLCSQAQGAVARFSGGQTLSRISRWADEIRYVPAWEHTAPWHYMNIADDEPLTQYRTPGGGDVLWAIEEFMRRLGDETLAVGDRADALRFLVHFVVDIHQPLHVGRLSDRGGNTIALLVDGRQTNLHRLWDSGIIARDSLSPERYVASVMALADANAAEWDEVAPQVWAAESKRLRAFVYDFDGSPDSSYLDEAGRVLRRQLARAGVRLAATLNEIFCSSPEQ